MRTYPFNLTPSIKKGLISQENPSVNMLGLLDVRNAQPSPEGLVNNDLITSPITAQDLDDEDISSVYPSPTIYNIGSIRVIAGLGTLHYAINGWSLVAVNTHDAEQAGNVSIDIPVSDSETPWQHVELGNFGMLCNDECAIHGNVGINAFVNITNFPSTIAMYKGRLLMGRISGVLNLFGALPDNAVTYSAVGGGADAVYPIDLHRYPSDYAIECYRNGSCGYIICKDIGAVIQIVANDDGALVVGSWGLGYITTTNNPEFPLRYRKISGIGAYANISACAGLKRKIFIGSNSKLYEVSAQGEVTELGYSEHIVSLQSNKTSIWEDPKRGTFHMGDGTRSFVLTPEGLGDNYNICSGAVRDGDYLYGIHTDTTESFMFMTNAFDLSSREIKTVESIMATYSGLTAMRVRVWCKYDSGSTFIAGPWKPFNPEGVAYPLASAVEFKIQVRGVYTGDMLFSGMVVNYKNSDKRHSRGVTGVPENAD